MTTENSEYNIKTNEILTISPDNQYIDVKLSVSTSKINDNVPKTGDISPVFMLGSVLLLSVIEVSLFGYKKIKRRAALILIIVLMLGFMVVPVYAVDFNGSKVDATFSDELLENFKFDNILSNSGGAVTLKSTVGFEWQLKNQQ